MAFSLKGTALPNAILAQQWLGASLCLQRTLTLVPVDDPFYVRTVLRFRA